MSTPLNNVRDTPDAEGVLTALMNDHAGKRFDTSNEAETRLLVIDQILEHVLGWPRTAFHPEEGRLSSEGRLWIDYHLEASTAAKLVVEAKRNSRTFYLSTQPRSRTHRLSALRRNHGPELRAAIQQAVQYCSTTGTPGFLVTNGTQWIASLAFWPHADPERLDAVVYHDLEDILDNLAQFIDLLSPGAIANDALISAALQGQGRAPAFCESLNLSLAFNAPRDERNYLAAPLETVMRLCFDELDADNEVMLERCYVTNELTDGYVARFETFVGHTLPYELKGAAKIDRAPRSRPTSFEHAMRDRGEPLLLIGPVGSGKTTFLRFAAARLRKLVDQSPWVVLSLDLEPRTQTVAERLDHNQFRSELCRELLDQAAEAYPQHNPYEYDQLRQVFALEVRREVDGMPPNLRGTIDEDRRVDALLKELKGDWYRFLIRFLTCS